MEVIHGVPEDPRTNMNQWMASQVTPQCCAVTLKTPQLTNEDQRNHLPRHSRLLENQQKDQVYMDYTPPTQVPIQAVGPKEAESDADKRTIAKLRADLKRCKRKNKALKQQLKECLNVRELEKTLRMTLHSIGRNTPHSACSRPERNVPPWQGADWRHDLGTLVSEDGDGEDSRTGDTEHVQAPAKDCQEPLQGHGSCMFAYESPESQPYLTPESNMSKGERPMTGVFNHNTSSLLSSGGDKVTLHCQSQQDEIVPGHARNGLMLNLDTLNSLALKKGATYTLLTRNMMPLFFSVEEMATSCVRGERARGKGALTSPARRALDQNRVQAVINYVRQRFPHVQSYQIIQTMNQKLVDVRSKQKRTQQTTTEGRENSPTM